MKHPEIVRAAPKGVDWWRCVSCDREGEAKSFQGTPCKPPRPTRLRM